MSLPVLSHPGTVADDALGLIGGTPLVRLARLSPAGGGVIYGKLEAKNPAGSIKDRAALSMVLAAEREGKQWPSISAALEKFEDLEAFNPVAVEQEIYSFFGVKLELDKLAGEPVDLLVNGKLIARGEVVVIDENFGVRVTDIVGPAERVARMTGG